MTIKEMETLSDEELKKISMKKNGKCNYSATANRANKIRRERNGFWDDVHIKPLSFEETLLVEQGYRD